MYDIINIIKSRSEKFVQFNNKNRNIAPSKKSYTNSPFFYFAEKYRWIILNHRQLLNYTHIVLYYARVGHIILYYLSFL